MSGSRVADPPPLPIRHRAVAFRYLRLGEIAAAIAAYAYHVPADFVASAMLEEAPELQRLCQSDPPAR